MIAKSANPEADNSRINLIAWSKFIHTWLVVENIVLPLSRLSWLEVDDVTWLLRVDACSVSISVYLRRSKDLSRKRWCRMPCVDCPLISQSWLKLVFCLIDPSRLKMFHWHNAVTKWTSTCRVGCVEQSDTVITSISSLSSTMIWIDNSTSCHGCSLRERSKCAVKHSERVIGPYQGQTHSGFVFFHFYTFRRVASIGWWRSITTSSGYLTLPKWECLLFKC